eukprot:CAMPEP_0194350628 /NCGR_PEP_ID=MMETSP0171-20130528/107740_1 /TAXON_ID=218684 /ORGANISM="Corethron pennatum, Strain L29A3" /LENGTH=84 /DNA_ID=CAMNT_0039118191 /DNA_START=520 /DNA_END=775 /DNA_ORIENTATION=+
MTTAYQLDAAFRLQIRNNGVTPPLRAAAFDAYRLPSLARGKAGGAEDVSGFPALKTSWRPGAASTRDLAQGGTGPESAKGFDTV